MVASCREGVGDVGIVKGSPVNQILQLFFQWFIFTPKQCNSPQQGKCLKMSKTLGTRKVGKMSCVCHQAGSQGSINTRLMMVGMLLFFLFFPPAVEPQKSH